MRPRRATLTQYQTTAYKIMNKCFRMEQDLHYFSATIDREQVPTEGLKEIY